MAAPSSFRAAESGLPMARRALLGLLDSGRRDVAVVGASGVLVLVILLATLGRLAWTINPDAINLGVSLKGPSFQHPMGTDGLGRDVFARFNEGAGISLAVAGLVTLVGACIGGAIGLAGSASGGWADAALMRVMDAILAFPPLILAMTVTIGLGAGLATAGLGIMLTSIPWYARLVRSEVIRVRGLPFIEATVALGATRRRVVLRHILPNIAGTFANQTAAAFGYSILALAALSYVGLGAQVPTPEWGAMITDGQQYLLTGQWWISFFPGIGLLAVATAAGVLADRTRDILDPRGADVSG